MPEEKKSMHEQNGINSTLCTSPGKWTPSSQNPPRAAWPLSSQSIKHMILYLCTVPAEAHRTKRSNISRLSEVRKDWHGTTEDRFLDERDSIRKSPNRNSYCRIKRIFFYFRQFVKPCKSSNVEVTTESSFTSFSQYFMQLLSLCRKISKDDQLKILWNIHSLVAFIFQLHCVSSSCVVSSTKRSFPVNNEIDNFRPLFSGAARFGQCCGLNVE